MVVLEVVGARTKHGGKCHGGGGFLESMLFGTAKLFARTMSTVWIVESRGGGGAGGKNVKCWVNSTKTFAVNPTLAFKKDLLNCGLWSIKEQSKASNAVSGSPKKGAN